MGRFVNEALGLTENVAMTIIMFDCELGMVKCVVAMLRVRLCRVAVEHVAEQIW
jgi:hypothetical protein